MCSRTCDARATTSIFVATNLEDSPADFEERTRDGEPTGLATNAVSYSNSRRKSRDSLHTLASPIRDTDRVRSTPTQRGQRLAIG
jgi:hypothetical protein